MADRLTAMVSSTVADLPAHREQVRDACLRQDVYPLMMEHLSAADADAVEKSRSMVDGADLYLGVFAQRYGTIPPGYDCSITEMEYGWAKDRDIPRLIFLMDRSHPITVDEVDKGEAANRLETLRQRLEQERVRASFASPVELRAQVVQTLAEYRLELLVAENNDLKARLASLAPSGAQAEEAVTQYKRERAEVHHVSFAPPLPEPYVAHPYTLLDTRSLVGRRKDLALLTDWGSRRRDSEFSDTRFLAVCAVGGMGKSALTWTWFNEVAPLEMKSLAGRMWWSFYESDATFENFVTRALSYTTGRPMAELVRTPLQQRESELLRVLDERPFLLVLDGLERILLAYARLDAAHLVDGELDRRAAESRADEGGQGALAAESFYGQHRLRTTTDPRVGRWLRQLVGVRESRILASTRLFPAELQTPTADPVSGAGVHFLGGLDGDEAVELWRRFGLSGSRDELVPLFASFDNYPLLIRALAGEVQRYRPAPRDFDRWRADHPDFNPFELPMTQVKSHVLAFALAGLSDNQERLLHTIAAFRAPAGYDTLTALLVGADKTYRSEVELDADLTEIEDRGLIGWDRRANRYDQHPVVRGVAWQALDRRSKTRIYESLEQHYSALPALKNDDVRNAEDLTTGFELFYALVNLQRFSDAYDIVEDRLIDPTVRLGTWEQIREAMEALLDQRTGLFRDLDSSGAFSASAMLAVGLDATGRPDRSVAVWRRMVVFADDDSDRRAAAVMLALALVETGKLAEASLAADMSKPESEETRRDGSERVASGVVEASVGRYEAAELLLGGTQDEAVLDEQMRTLTLAVCRLAQFALLRGDLDAAQAVIDRARSAEARVSAPESAELAVVEGALDIRRGDYDAAERRLARVLEEIRGLRLVRPEILALLELAELSRLRGDYPAARSQLSQADDLAERGGYVQRQADSANRRAAVERRAGDNRAAIEAAQLAFRLAWCDGPPYAYAAGLDEAREILRSLGAGVPSDLTPFDPEAHDLAAADYLARNVDQERQSLMAQMKDAAPEVRAEMVPRLAMLAGSEILLEYLPDPAPEVRVAVLREYSRWLTDQVRGEVPVDPDKVAPMIGRLDDDGPEVRVGAISALVRYYAGTSTEMASTFRNRLSDLLPGDVLRDLSRGIDLPLSAAPHEGVQPLLAALTSDASAAVRQAALEAYALLAPSIDGDLLRERLADDDAGVRAVAVEAVRIRVTVDTGALLAARLGDPDPSIRLRAAEVMAEDGNSEAIEFLIGQLNDENDTTRAAAIRALARGPDPRVDRMLEAYTNDSSPEVRAAALMVLPGWSPDNADTYAAALADDDHRVTSAASSAIKWERDSRIDEWLLGMLGDPEARVRARAATMLGERYTAGFHAGSEWVEPVVALLDDPSLDVRAAAIQALGSEGGERARDVLADALADRNLADLAAQALVDRRDPRALAYLRTHLTDPSASRRIEALATLAPTLGEVERTLLSRDIDGMRPYLDPRQPLSQHRIEAVARRMSRPVEEVRASYEDLAAELSLPPLRDLEGLGAYDG